MNYYKENVAGLSLAITSMLLLSGCTSSTTYPPEPPCKEPVKIAALCDWTNSGIRNGVQSCTKKDLLALMQNPLLACAGELAVASVAEDAASDLLRTLVNNPFPKEPLKKDFPDPFTHRKKLKEWQENEEMIRKGTEEFIEAAKLHLERSAQASHSAVYANLKRLNTWLAQENTFNTQPKTFLLIASDMQDNAGGASFELPPTGTQVIIVGPYHPSPNLLPDALIFESVGQAVSFIQHEGRE